MIHFDITNTQTRLTQKLNKRTIIIAIKVLQNKQHIRINWLMKKVISEYYASILIICRLQFDFYPS